MDKQEAKRGIVLNYGLMMADLEDEMREKADFMHGRFLSNPDIKAELDADPDLQDIGAEFHALLVQFKKLDRVIDRVSKYTLTK